MLPSGDCDLWVTGSGPLGPLLGDQAAQVTGVEYVHCQAKPGASMLGLHGTGSSRALLPARRPIFWRVGQQVEHPLYV